MSWGVLVRESADGQAVCSACGDTQDMEDMKRLRGQGYCRQCFFEELGHGKKEKAAWN